MLVVVVDNLFCAIRATVADPGGIVVLSEVCLLA